MKITFMKKSLLEIFHIKNLQVIDIFDLYPSASDFVLPAMYIMYDGGKQMQLCSKDDYFDVFIRKVVQVYHDETAQIFEDSLSDPFKLRKNGIQITDEDRKILESGILTQKNRMYQFYSDKDSYSDSLLSNKDNFGLLLPIVKYHLSELFSYMSTTVTFDNTFSGYRSRYAMFCKVDGITNAAYINYEVVGDNEYVFTISGLLDNIPIKMRLKFKNDCIEVVSTINSFDLTYSNTYQITGDMVKRIDMVERAGAEIYYSNTDLEACEVAQNISNANYQWFRLPWGAYYGINDEVTKLREREAIVEIEAMYLFNDKDRLFAKEYYSKAYKYHETNGRKRNDVILDNAIKDVKGVLLPGGQAYLIETTFLDTLYSSGYYNEVLENKHFYHLSKGIDVSTLKPEDLVYISRGDGVFTFEDIPYNERILARVKGEK